MTRNAKCVYMFSASMVMATIGVLSPAQGQQKHKHGDILEAPYVWGKPVETVAGKVVVTRTEKWLRREGEGEGPRIVFDVTLDGKPVLEEYDRSIRVKATYPKDGPAQLLLLVVWAGGVNCPAYYRVLEVKDKKVFLTNEFGNCLEAVVGDERWMKSLGVTENPVYRNGEWHIAFPKAGVSDKEFKKLIAQGKALEWYVYHDGKVLNVFRKGL